MEPLSLRTKRSEVKRLAFCGIGELWNHFLEVAECSELASECIEATGVELWNREIVEPWSQEFNLIFFTI